VPLLKEEELIGAISIMRMVVRPFTEKQIDLMTVFARQATIALETTRRERQYREAQLELAHANRIETMGQLTASVAHELKQPLAAVVMGGNTALSWLAGAASDTEKAKRSLETIVKDAKRAIDVINRIHGLVKKDEPLTETLNINDAIVEVIALTRSQLVKDGVSVQTRLADSLPHIKGDWVQLQQVMLNLLVNAIQAMSGVAEGKRQLHISTENTGSQGVRVAVRDSGPGLSGENFQRVFEPFYTTKPNGMGMGLSICRSIIEHHGGRLWVTSHEPQGALFQFTIPANGM
jgi:C4-dicarboxylate-specific signal transduction histidine kinase